MTYWVAASFLNVRADRVLQWPEPHEIGSLKLGFIRLDPKAPQLRVVVITLCPLIIGVVVTDLIATFMFNFRDVTTLLAQGTLSAFYTGIHNLTMIPDIAIWLYITFTIGNTMIPDGKYLRWITGLVLAIALIVAVSTTSQIINVTVIEVLITTSQLAINTLSGVLGLIIAIDLLFIVGLAAVENLIEWITGDSADFEKGELVTMTRAERLEKHDRDIQRERQRRKRLKAKTPRAEPPSIYQVPFPIPGTPDEIRITPMQAFLIPDGQSKSSQRSIRKGRAGASLIPGKFQDNEPDSDTNLSEHP